MEIFPDTANLEEIKRYALTTNPTLIAQEKGRYRFQDLIQQITKVVDGPVSVEAVTQTADEMVREAEGLASMVEHHLTDAGLAKFLEDWKKVTTTSG